jgi:hypothetical protein
VGRIERALERCGLRLELTLKLRMLLAHGFETFIGAIHVTAFAADAAR